MSIQSSNNMFSLKVLETFLPVPKCPSCNERFAGYNRDKRTPRRPLILKCAHLICEQCLRHSNNGQSIKCTRCNEVTPKFDSKNQVNSFYHSFHINGLMNFIDYEVPRIRNGYDNLIWPQSQQVDKQIKASAILSSTANRHVQMNFINKKLAECSECTFNQTDQICLQCNVPYCETCFTNIHKTGKALRQHKLADNYLENTKQSSNIVENDIKKKMCDKHFGIPLDYFCMNCSEVCCCECKLEKHSQHTISMLVLENRKKKANIREQMEKINQAIMNVKKSQQEIGQLQKHHEKLAESAVTELSEYFNDIYAKLQIFEMESLMEVKRRLLILNNRCSKAQTTLVDAETELTKKCDLIKTITSSNSTTNVLPNVFDEIGDFLKITPCYVKYDNTQNPFRFNRNECKLRETVELEFTGKPFNPTFFSCFNELLENSVTSTVTSPSSSSKTKQSQVQPKKSIKQNKNINRKLYETFNYKSKCSSQNSLNHSISSTKSPTSLNVSTAIDDAYKSLSERSSFTSIANNLISAKVYVSYIENPSKFFVQYQSFLAIENEFYKKCNEYSKLGIKPNKIQINGLYLIKTTAALKDLNTKGMHFHRVKVLDKNEKNIYRVQFVDIGRQEKITNINCFYEISEELYRMPFGAIECSIYNLITEKKNKKWLPESTQLMIDIISNQNVVLFIADDISPVKLVDIFIIHKLYPLTIRDALLFFKYGAAITQTNQSIQQAIQRIEHFKSHIYSSHLEKQTIPRPIIQKDEFVNVKIINIISPHEFYISNIANLEKQTKMNELLNEKYNSQRNLIYTPREGMLCAVLINNLWHRGKIISVTLLADNNCSVWLIDVGTLVFVHWQYIHALDNEFVQYEAHVIRCGLIEIQPLNSDNIGNEISTDWPNESIIAFKRFAKYSNLNIMIETNRNDFYYVLLFIKKKKRSICVNSLMSMEKFAKSTGTVAYLPKTYRLDDNDDDNDDDDDDDDSDNINNDYNSSVHSYATATPVSCNISLRTKTYQNSMGGDPRTEIKVVQIIDPSEIYVSLTKHLVGIEKLHTEIQNFQINNKNQTNKSEINDESDFKEIIEWKINDHCLVRTILDKQNKSYWFRGKIISIEQNNYLIIFLRDRGIKCKVQINDENIMPIDLKFDNIADGVVRCHLACISPTGGQIKWTSSSIDQLKCHVEDFDNISVTNYGLHNENNSIPVILWGLTTICNDPLTSQTMNWSNINNILVNTGFAHLTKPFPLIIENKIHNDFENIFKLSKCNFDNWLTNLITVGAPKLEHYDNIDNNSFISINQLHLMDDNADDELVTEWLPPKLIEKHVFSGIPTYLDNNGIIYLHDANEMEFIKQLKISINEKMIKQINKCGKELNVQWKNGMPCIAKYHLDGQLYRANILRCEPIDKIKIQFIDYGNVETCHRDDLFIAKSFGKIPTMARKYFLANIKPNNDTNIWPTNILDFIHIHLIDKVCSVTKVNFKDDSSSSNSIASSSKSVNKKIEKPISIITPCKIKANQINIIELLIQKSWAVYTTEQFPNENVDILSDLYEGSDAKSVSIHSIDSGSVDGQVDNKFKKSIDDSKKVPNNFNTPSASYDEYKKLFKLKRYELPPLCDENENNAIINTDDIVIKSTIPMNSWYFDRLEKDMVKNDEILSDINDTNLVSINSVQQLPYQNQYMIRSSSVVEIIDDDANETDNDTNSSINIPWGRRSLDSLIKTLKPFKQMTLFESSDGFPAKYITNENCLTIWLRPLTQEHQQHIQQLKKNIQFIVHKCKVEEKFKIDTICLVKSEKTKKYHRAIIDKIDENLANLTVTQIDDNVKVGLVKMSNCRVCPKTILDAPLENVLVKLHGLQLNKRIRESDVERNIKQILSNTNNLQVIVIKNGNENNLPEVKLYINMTNSDSSTIMPKVLAYQKLIDDGYIIEI